MRFSMTHMNTLSEEVRTILNYSHPSKRMRIPDYEQRDSSAAYLQAVLMRVKGVWGISSRQEDVAKAIGVSSATLKRYISEDGKCPFAIQFTLESLAGMAERGRLFQIVTNSREDAICPFAIKPRSTINFPIAVLTESELDLLIGLYDKHGKIFRAKEGDKEHWTENFC